MDFFMLGFLVMVAGSACAAPKGKPPPEPVIPAFMVDPLTNGLTKANKVIYRDSTEPNVFTAIINVLHYTDPEDFNGLWTCLGTSLSDNNRRWRDIVQDLWSNPSGPVLKRLVPLLKTAMSSKNSDAFVANLAPVTQYAATHAKDIDGQEIVQHTINFGNDQVYLQDDIRQSYVACLSGKPPSKLKGANSVMGL